MTLLPDKLILPARTSTGHGIIKRLISECTGFGPRGLIVHGKSLRNNGVLSQVMRDVPDGLSVKSWEHSGGEPTLDHLAELLAEARQYNAAWIAGVGGGSVMDLSKSCAGLFNTKNELSSYHDGARVESKGIHFIAVPTTAGTGSEATVNAVLTNSLKGQKKSIRDDAFIARLVLLDPELIMHCPKQVIAYSGLDAFTQAIEAYTSRNAVWLSDEFALKGMALIASNLESVYNGATGEAPEHLLIGSYFAGLAFSMARLGVVHGLAHPLGARYQFPHGLICGLCLPHAIEINRKAMGSKYDRMSDAVGHDLLTKTRTFLDRLGIKSLFRGKSLKDKDGIIHEALASGSTAANPKKISASDIEFLLTRLFG